MALGGVTIKRTPPAPPQKVEEVALLSAASITTITVVAQPANIHIEIGDLVGRLPLGGIYRVGDVRDFANALLELCDGYDEGSA